MRWDSFYDTNASRKPGLMHGGFFVVQPPGRTDGFYGNHIGVGPDVWLTNHHYDTTVSETRITSYLGIMTGQVPAKHYFAMWRTFPATCDWYWQEMQPVGENRTYLGVDVYEGAYTYRGMHIVPGWGGSMFEELMPDVFVPESSWAPRSWGLNHPLHVRAQREHGLDRGRLRLLGLLAVEQPDGWLPRVRRRPARPEPDGYLSDIDQRTPTFLGTNYDAGFGECRDGDQPRPDLPATVSSPRTPPSSR